MWDYWKILQAPKYEEPQQRLDSFGTRGAEKKTRDDCVNGTEKQLFFSFYRYLILRHLPVRTINLAEYFFLISKIYSDVSLTGSKKFILSESLCFLS